MKSPSKKQKRRLRISLKVRVMSTQEPMRRTYLVAAATQIGRFCLCACPYISLHAVLVICSGTDQSQCKSNLRLFFAVMAA